MLLPCGARAPRGVHDAGQVAGELVPHGQGPQHIRVEGQQDRRVGAVSARQRLVGRGLRTLWRLHPELAATPLLSPGEPPRWFAAGRRLIPPLVPMLSLSRSRLRLWLSAAWPWRRARATSVLLFVVVRLLAPLALAASRGAYPVGADHRLYGGIDRVAAFYLCSPSNPQGRVASADYLLMFRKSGENKVPVAHPTGLMDYAGERQIPSDLMKYKGWKGKQTENRYSHWIWRQYARSLIHI